MNATLALGRRALREAIRQPDALFMTLFIPIFFLVVNTGQAAKIFPSDSTGFLQGQGYGAFQLPITLLLAASFGMAALFLVEEIEGGYFDKLRAIADPALRDRPRPAGRRGRQGLLIATRHRPARAAVRDHDRQRRRSASCCSSCSPRCWGVVYAGFMQIIALKTRSAAATNSGGLIFFPLLFLTPNFVPRDMLTRPMEVAATFNPVTYLMEALRSLILDDLDWAGPAGVRRRRRARRDDARAHVRMIRNYD